MLGSNRKRSRRHALGGLADDSDAETEDDEPSTEEIELPKYLHFIEIELSTGWCLFELSLCQLVLFLIALVEFDPRIKPLD